MTTKIKEFRIERTAYLTTGTSTAYAVTATGIDTAIDYEITIEPHLNCAAGPVTLNVNGGGAVTIKGPDGNDLAADDLVANVPVKLFFDASQSLFFLLVRNIVVSVPAEIPDLPVNSFYPFSGMVLMREGSGSNNSIYETDFGTYRDGDDIYFACAVGWYENGIGSGARAFATLLVSKYNVITGAITRYDSTITNTYAILTGVRSTGTQSTSLTIDSGVIYYSATFSNPSITQHIEFDTSTDTFDLGGTGSPNNSQTRFRNSNNIVSAGSEVMREYVNGLAGGTTGSAMTNNESYLGYTYSTGIELTEFGSTETGIVFRGRSLRS